MSKLSVPAGGWSTSATGWLLVAVVAPAAVVLLLSPSTRDLHHLTTTAGVALFSVGLLAAVLLHLHWRLTRAETSAWLSAGVALTSLHGLALTTVEWQHPGSGATFYLAISNLLVGALLMLLARLLRSGEPGAGRLDPLGLGLVGGTVLSVGHVATARGDPGGALPPGSTVSCALVLVACGATLALAAERASDLPTWALRRIQAVLVLVFLRQALVLVQPTTTVPRPALQIAELVADVAAAVVVGATALALLRLAIRDEHRMLTALRTRLVDLEAGSRADRERMHEVTGTIAGIASVTELMSSSRELSPADRPDLERMVAQEAARLHRLLQDARPGVPVAVAVEQVLRPLVIGHRAQGHVVHWEPDERWVAVAPDALAQAVSVLLANAARHAPGSPVTIRVSDEPGWVAIRVSDSGPGIDHADVGSLFVWGARGSASPGSGIGLHLARRLLSEGGGRLTYDARHRPGASFVIGVRRARPPLTNGTEP